MNDYVSPAGTRPRQNSDFALGSDLLEAGEKPLRVLLVTGYFPPYAPFSATRTNALAKYLLERGHDVRVLAPKNTSFPPTLTADIPTDRILYTPIYEVLNFPGILKAKIKHLLRRGAPKSGNNGQAPAAPNAVVEPTSSSRPTLWKWALRNYNNIVSLPDPRIGWYPFGVKAGRQLLSEWRADIIHASAPPHTGLLVAARLSRITGIPWVCEYRDLWVDHPYYDNGAIKRKIESWLERRTLKTAAGFVTVTSTWLDWLRAKHPQPAQLAMNGFDPDDYPPEELPPLDPDKLTIIYAGGLYHGKRDPSPLFEALHLMGAKADQVRLIFHVAEPQMVTALAKQHGVSNHVEVHGVISRGEIIRKQCAADVLLLLRWDDPGEDSVLAGKLFEYIGARRHILSVGREHGEAADLIRDHDLGVVSKDPNVIAETLKFWLAAKNNGRLPSPENSADQLSRSSQFTELERFLGWVVQAHTESPTTNSEHIRAK